MPWAFLVWILCFCLQAALVGIIFYTLIQLSDFEMDYINNFDAAKRCNRWVVPEACIQVTAFVLSLVSGHYVAAVLNVPGVILIANRFLKRKEYLEPLELWKQLPAAQRAFFWKLGAAGVTFTFTMFRLMEIIVHQVLSDHGRQVMKHVFKEAMGNIHF